MRSIIQSGLNTVPVADLIFYDPRFRMCALWVGGVCVCLQQTTTAKRIRTYCLRYREDRQSQTTAGWFRARWSIMPIYYGPERGSFSCMRKCSSFA